MIHKDHLRKVSLLKAKHHTEALRKKSFINGEIAT
jgi:hypothetical protein